jgi:hypothetical protein
MNTSLPNTTQHGLPGTNSSAKDVKSETKSIRVIALSTIQ